MVGFEPLGRTDDGLDPIAEPLDALHAHAALEAHVRTRRQGSGVGRRDLAKALTRIEELVTRAAPEPQTHEVERAALIDALFRLLGRDAGARLAPHLVAYGP